MVPYVHILYMRGFQSKVVIALLDSIILLSGNVYSLQKKVVITFFNLNYLALQCPALKV